MGRCWGLNISSSTWEKCEPKPPIVNDNPDPANYKIVDILEIDEMIIVKINYPNCSNYEGNKILVFYKVTMIDLMNAKIIDPHFTNVAEVISPVARFKPDNDGWEMAKRFCNSWRNQKYMLR